MFFKQKTDIVNEVTYRYPIIVRWKHFYLEGVTVFCISH